MITLRSSKRLSLKAMLPGGLGSMADGAVRAATGGEVNYTDAAAGAAASAAGAVAQGASDLWNWVTE